MIIAGTVEKLKRNESNGFSELSVMTTKGIRKLYGFAPGIQKDDYVQAQCNPKDNGILLNTTEYKIENIQVKTEVKGNVKDIKFRNAENGWSVMQIHDEVTGESVTATGIAPDIMPGMTVIAAGRFEKTKYGPQLRMETCKSIRPDDEKGIYNYLISDRIRSVGPIFAKMIVKAFGSQTWDVIENHPERLKELKGVGPKRISALVAAVKNDAAFRDIFEWLGRYDITKGIANKIFNTYGDLSIAVLEENPYKLVDDIKGVGFKKADAVAVNLGIPNDSPYRIYSGLKACLEAWANEGNTYMPVDGLAERTASEDYLDIDVQKVKDAIESGEFFQVGEVEDGKAYLPKYYHAEKKIARRLREVLDNAYNKPDYEPDFDKIERRAGVHYSSQQREAIRDAIQYPALILTGGPGTGKTTTTNAIISECQIQGYNVVLAAPTGRAAKRMTESTGKEAKTIHRLLEFSQGEFQRNEDNPIDADVIVIDEASMIDAILMRDLMSAVSKRSKLIFVGDIDQLPSVGAGCILRDLIDSRLIKTVSLTEVYRQAQGSAIITNAHLVNHGKMPVILNNRDSDFFFLENEDKEKISQTIVDLVCRRLPERMGFKTSDIQVLSPMKREGGQDPISTYQLNHRIQEAVNHDGAVAARCGMTEFRIGDRVMQTKNNYDKEIFNGDIGIVTAKVTQKEREWKDPDFNEPEDEKPMEKAVMEAEFDGRKVRFTQEDLSDLELSYACTIHKSQGSEYPVVIMPVHNSHFIMLKRNLLYTGITRAKKLCILVGTKEAIKNASFRTDTEKRYTMLRERIIEEADKAEKKQERRQTQETRRKARNKTVEELLLKEAYEYKNVNKRHPH